MKLLRNAFALISRPALAGDYMRFRLSQARHGGESVRAFPSDNLIVGGLSGFSEFHSCVRYINESERQFMMSFPFGDGPILDVGGNLGIFSLQMARRFPGRTIHAFEPNPSTFLAMRANFARNGCPTAHAHALAIAAHDGEISFQADATNRATTHIVPENRFDARANGAPVVHVPCVTLDGFLERHGIGEVGLVKVDVEGYEEMVFRGADGLLSDGRAKVIYYEVCPALTRRAGFSPDAPSRRLLARGYSLNVLDEHGELQPTDLARITSVTLENWVAVWDGVAQP